MEKLPSDDTPVILNIQQDLISRPFAVRSESLGLLSIAGDQYVRWSQQEIVKMYAQGSGLRDVLIGGLQGIGKSTFINETVEHWSMIMPGKKHYLLTTGAGIAAARKMGLVRSSLGEMTAEEYNSVDVTLLLLNNLAHRYLEGPGWLWDEFVMVTGMPISGRGRNRFDMYGVSRGTWAAKEIISRDPFTSMLLLHGDGSISRRTMEYRQQVLNSTSAGQVAEVNLQYGVIDERPWTEIIKYLKQTANRESLDQGEAAMQDVLFRINQRGLMDMDRCRDRAEFDGYMQDSYWSQTMVIGEYLPLFIERLYGDWQSRSEIVDRNNSIASRAIVVQNRLTDKPRLTGSRKLVGVMDGLIQQAKINPELQQILCRLKLAD